MAKLEREITRREAVLIASVHLRAAPEKKLHGFAVAAGHSHMERRQPLTRACMKRRAAYEERVEHLAMAEAGGIVQGRATVWSGRLGIHPSCEQLPHLGRIARLRCLVQR